MSVDSLDVRQVRQNSGTVIFFFFLGELKVNNYLQVEAVRKCSLVMLHLLSTYCIHCSILGA